MSERASKCTECGNIVVDESWAKWEHAYNVHGIGFNEVVNDDGEWVEI